MPTVDRIDLPPETMSHQQVHAAGRAFDALKAMGVEVKPCAFEHFWWKISTQTIYGPKPFTWGRVLKVHEIGPYSIVEFKRNQAGNVSDEDYAASEPNISFSLFIDGWMNMNGWKGSRDVGHSYHTLDAALIAGVVKRHEQINHGHNAALNESLSGYIMRLLKG